MKFNEFEKLYERYNSGADLMNEAQSIDEGVLSSITNFFSRMFGGAVSKLDDILKKYKKNEKDYWTDWADERGRFDEADALSKVPNPDQVDRMKYDEQKARIKKLEEELEKKRKTVNDALDRQAANIIKSSARLKDYYEMKKAKTDEEAAKESFEVIKRSTDNDTIHELFDNEIQKAVQKAKKKNEEFKSKYGIGKFTDEAPASADNDINISGININDLLDKPVADLQNKLKDIPADKLGEILKYLEKEVKKIKDQKDEDIKSIKAGTGDKGQQNKDVEDVTKKSKALVDNIQAKVDYLDKLILAAKANDGKKEEPKKEEVKAVVAELKKDTDVVTAVAKEELGDQKVDQTIKTAVAQTVDSGKEPNAEEVAATINKQAVKFFADAKFIIENETGEMSDAQYGHLTNDLMNLFGKLTFYYKKENKEMNIKVLQMGIVDFAGEIYKYKKENDKVDSDLTDEELNKLFDKFNESK